MFKTLNSTYDSLEQYLPNLASYVEYLHMLENALHTVPTISKGSRCSIVVELTPNDSEVVGSNLSLERVKLT